MIGIFINVWMGMYRQHGSAVTKYILTRAGEFILTRDGSNLVWR
jgi:hypothetical protein